MAPAHRAIHRLGRRSAPRPKLAAALAGAVVLGGLLVVPSSALAEGAACASSVPQDRIVTGTSLTPGKPITSPSGNFTFGLSANGDLALTRTASKARSWLKQGGTGATVTFDQAGTLVLRSARGSVVWTSLPSAPCAELVVQDSGRVALITGASLAWTLPLAAASWDTALPTSVVWPTATPTSSPSVTPTPTSAPSASPSAQPTPPPATGTPSPSATPSTTPTPTPAPTTAPTTPAPTKPAPAPTTPAPAPTTPAPAPTTNAPVPPPPPAPPMGGTRNAAQYPFSSSSPWNTAVGSGAAFQGENDAATKSLRLATPTVNSTRWSFAVFQAKASDAVSTVTNTSNGKTYQVRMPAETAPTYGSDMHVGIITPDGYTGYEFYKMTKVSATQWTTTRVTITDLRGDGAGGSRASNTSIFAGLIRTEELGKLSIRHALAVAVPDEALKSGFVWPALAQDSNAATAYSGSLPMGSLAALPPNVDLSTLGLSGEGMALGKALQDYGAYVALRSGTTSLFCEQTCDPNQVNALKSAWQKLLPLMRVVTNNGPTSVGGGGTPRVAPLDALA